jgi:hypothetical protein
MPWSISDLALSATAVIALVALLRPDIERVFQRRKAVIDVHPAGRLEVGFSNFGPTIGCKVRCKPLTVMSSSALVRSRSSA